MGCAVYANGMSIACKVADGKTIAAMPDVCLSPPSPPAGPLPIPYPNTAMASDTTDGSKTVQIGGQEVMLKNKSTFKTSSGDEAATKSFGMGVVTHQIQGKANFVAWSMDVKFEGENVPRHLDLMGHNEASSPPNTPPWPYADKMAAGVVDRCKTDKDKEQNACKDYKPNGEKDVCETAGLSGGVIQENAVAQAEGFADASSWASAASKRAAANECVKARRCQLVPYDAEKDGINGCCPSQTPDHLIPKSSFFKVAFGGAKLDSWPDYDYKKAPCMCAEGGSNTAGSHGLRHAHHKANGPEDGEMQSFSKQADLAAEGATTVFKSSGCSKECIKAQLENGHKGMGDRRTKIKHSPSGSVMTNPEITAQSAQLSPTTVAE